MSSFQDPADWVDEHASTRPRCAFLRTPQGRELSYGALREETDRIASALAARGVMPGDRVAVQVDKSVDAVLLYVTCLTMGVVFVPINVANTANEVDYFLRDSQPRLAVIRPADRSALEPLVDQARVQHLETLGTEGEGTLPELVSRCAVKPRSPRTAGANALAAIVYTSGTTGRAKGAMLTRGNLASNAAALAEAWRFTRADVLLHTLPLFHVHGLFAAINTVLASGSSLLLMAKFDAPSVMAHLPHATVYMGVPTHYTRLLREPGLDSGLTANMRLFVSGSAPLLAATHREFSSRTGHMILERYGMTETLMNTSNPYDGARVPGSVGPALPGVAIRMLGEGSEVDESSGDVGALEIKGPNVFAGYWADAAKTRDAFTADGWFKTGDLGRIDEEGYVYIVGRAKDLVISGGYNVYPKEVETELDAVAGVAESAVFGVPHPDLGEGVTAAVVREAGAVLSEAGIIGALKTRLAGYK
ncbi:MAG: malonyl-CoA synthase, partial [Gammaproteobacteria bacterium]|nr:malonyl-CoA synthase [Gammaproteobacteria bacterium]